MNGIQHEAERHGTPRAALDTPAPRPVVLTGPLAGIRFPDLCARCAARPAGTLPLVKMFRRDYSEGPTEYVFGRVAVPFCGACLAAHERERRPIDPRVLRSLRNAWFVKSLPYVFPIVAIVYMLAQMLGDLGPMDVRGLVMPSPVEMLILGAVPLFYGVCLAGFVRLVLAARRNLIANWSGDPNAQYVEIVRGYLGTTCVIPGPPTSTLAAVDFSDERFQLFEPKKRSFTFTNPVVATEFAAANTGQVWNPNSPRAQWASRMRRAVMITTLAVAGAVVLLRDLLGF